MGFLNKLFGGSNVKEEDRSPNQRAPLKNAKYFEVALKQKDERIAMDKKTRETLLLQGRAEPYHDWSLALDYLMKFSVAYSMGQPMESCYDLFITASDWYAKGWEPDSAYADMLDMVSIGYLLQIPDDKYNGIVQYVEQSDKGSDYAEWRPDGILWFIINARKATGPTPDAVIWPSLYQSLLEITRMNKEEATVAMKQYLEKWYDLHSNDPWYNNHTKDHAYTGYWCWEAGAITKIMQLDDSSFKDSPYYPYDLVHWRR
ncbi:uncharacterized protein DUF1910 [Chitinophaga dinghuensis]|uniref:Uncharacterized protein DUF1910 n=1 Tax=Chitinophaga dinghuensis TaxID=1539050 RepID=A0A327WFE8_9BACT|nr:PoNe immunity protein domain-containing protein [Chitinophaga dinghuensis]RAJ88080.1 uncharacterized protein DUF1910 [Chitinophaga dinghuensis]